MSDGTAGQQQESGDDGRIRRRRRVAELVVARARGDVGEGEFRDAVRPFLDGDPEVVELVGLVERAPTRSWFFGVDRHSVQDDSDRIAELVAQFLGARPSDPAPEVRTRRSPREE